MEIFFDLYKTDNIKPKSNSMDGMQPEQRQQPGGESPPLTEGKQNIQMSPPFRREKRKRKKAKRTRGRDRILL